jgi:hypothetical protein
MQLYHPGHPLIHLFQPVQRIIKLGDSNIRIHPETQTLVKCNLLPTSATFHSGFLASVVYENLAHGPGGNPEEVSPVLPFDSCLVNQAAICLMHECCWLQGVINTLFAHQAGCKITELVVYDLEYPVRIGTLAGLVRLKGEEELGEFAMKGWRHNITNPSENEKCDSPIPIILDENIRVN